LSITVLLVMPISLYFEGKYQLPKTGKSLSSPERFRKRIKHFENAKVNNPFCFVFQTSFWSSYGIIISIFKYKIKPERCLDHLSQLLLLKTVFKPEKMACSCQSIHKLWFNWFICHFLKRNLIIFLYTSIPKNQHMKRAFVFIVGPFNEKVKTKMIFHFLNQIYLKFCDLVSFESHFQHQASWIRISKKSFIFRISRFNPQV
jgi:hypothetical protein